MSAFLSVSPTKGSNMQVEYKVVMDVPNTENSVEEGRQILESAIHAHVTLDVVVTADKF
jgi:hypothetical protein